MICSFNIFDNKKADYFPLLGVRSFKKIPNEISPTEYSSHTINTYPANTTSFFSVNKYFFTKINILHVEIHKLLLSRQFQTQLLLSFAKLIIKI